MLRLRDGEAIAAADGTGSWRPCRWRAGGLEADGPVEVEAAPVPQLAVAFVPTKGDRPEWAVQKLTELGVDRIVVASSARAVVRWQGDRAAGHLERLAEVARQAGMQSRRVRLPRIDGVVPVESLADEPGWSLAEPAGGPLPALDPASPVGVAVGPEGGWTSGELERFRLVGLGDPVLRAETATVAAGVLLCALRAGLV